MDKTNKKTKRRFDNTLTIFMILISLLFLIEVVGYTFVNFTRKKVDVIEVSNGIIDVPVDYNALIIRDEKIYNAPATGSMVAVISNGDIVPKNKPIAYVSNATSKSVSVEQDAKYNEIKYNSNTEKYNKIQTTVEAYNSNIKNIIDNRSYDTIQDKYLYYGEIRKELEKRATAILSDETNYNEQLMQNNENVIISEQRGVVNYYMNDVNQKHYTVNDIKDIKQDDIPIELQYTDSINRNVNEGDPAVKVIDTDYWYIITYVPNQVVQDSGLNVGSDKDVYVYNDEDGYSILNMQVVSINQEGDNSKVVFKSNDFMNEYMNMQSTTVRLDRSHYEGIKIPISSITNKGVYDINTNFIYDKIDENGNVLYEYVVRENYDGTTTECVVDIYSSDEVTGITQVFVDTSDIKMDDKIRTGTGDRMQIKESYEIKGVFVANNGVATFKQIFIDEESIKNQIGTGYIILDPKTNPYLKVYDKIVLNSDEVVEGEILH